MSGGGLEGIMLNAIGMKSFGIKNARNRFDRCSSCRRETSLKTYDASTFFVFCHVPLVPLGKKHIVDECEHCGMRTAIPLKDWERDAEEAIGERFREFESNRKNPEAATRLHAAYRTYGRREEEKDLRTFLDESFGRNVDVQMYLAETARSDHRFQHALRHYEKALELSPDNPTIRLETGMQRLRKGDLEGAHALLRSYEEDQPARKPAVLWALSHAYLKAGDTEEAARLKDLATGRKPGAVDSSTAQPAFGNSAADTSYRTGGWGIKPWILGTVAVLLFTAILYLVNYYVSQHRTVYIVNGSDRPVTVAIDGKEYVVRDHGPLKISLAEGTHTATYSGGIDGQTQFTLEGGLTERYNFKNVHILNPNGLAALGYETAEYATNPNPNAGTYHIRYGTEFECLGGIDYAFREFPAQIQLDSSVSRVMKNRVELVDASSTEIFDWLQDEEGLASALRYAECLLKKNPQDIDLLSEYVFSAIDGKHDARVRAVLKRGCEIRPFRYGWHKIHQLLEIGAGRYSKVLRTYETLLEKTPHDANLLCLRANLEYRRPAWSDLVQRALTIEPNHPVALGLMAAQYAEHGQWKAARDQAIKALAAGSPVNGVDEIRLAARLALGEHAQALKELRKEVRRDPTAYYKRQYLTLALLDKKDLKAVKQVRNEYQRALRNEDYNANYIRGQMNGLHALQLYVQGRYADLLRNYGNKPNDEGGWRYEAFIGLGRLDEAEDLLDEDPSLNTWENLMTLSAALHGKGEQKRAAALFEAAREELLDGGPRQVAVAGLLTKGRIPALERLNNIVLYYHQKAILAVVLAQREPEGAAELMALARRLCVPHYFPHDVIEKLTEASVKP